MNQLCVWRLQNISFCQSVKAGNGRQPSKCAYGRQILKVGIIKLASLKKWLFNCAVRRGCGDALLRSFTLTHNRKHHDFVRFCASKTRAYWKPKKDETMDVLKHNPVNLYVEPLPPNLLSSLKRRRLAVGMMVVCNSVVINAANAECDRVGPPPPLETVVVTAPRVPPPHSPVVIGVPPGYGGGYSFVGGALPPAPPPPPSAEEEKAKAVCLAKHKTKLAWCEATAKSAYAINIKGCRYYGLIPFGNVHAQCLSEQGAIMDADLTNCRRDFQHNSVVECE